MAEEIGDTRKAYKKEIEEIIWYSGLMYDRRLVSAAGGNVSMRCGNDRFLITAGGASLRSLEWEDILLCDFEGRVLDGGSGKKPSKEIRIHMYSYLVRPELTCVVHLHPSHVIAVTAYDRDLPLYTASARLKLKSVPTVKEAEPGTEELAEMVRLAMEANKESRVCLLKAHGAVIMGKKLKECFETAELLEDTAQIAILAKDRLLMERNG